MKEELEAGHSSRSLRDVIVDASAIRLRPIFLTTVTTVGRYDSSCGSISLGGRFAFAIMFSLSFCDDSHACAYSSIFLQVSWKSFAQSKR